MGGYTPGVFVKSLKTNDLFLKERQRMQKSLRIKGSFCNSSARKKRKYERVRGSAGKVSGKGGSGPGIWDGRWDDQRFDGSGWDCGTRWGREFTVKDSTAFSKCQ